MLDNKGASATNISTSHNDDQNAISFGEEGHKPRHKAKMSKKTKLGRFHSMSFSKPVFEGIMRVGYKNPTPIQRAAIPVILSGQDVVAMARTGSGKTACFLLPMFEALKAHSASTGARALILEPTRELAEQTLRFAVKLGKWTGLHCTLVVGGDSMDEQFGALHKNPDIIIATPGRLMHVCVEMNLRLDHVQYVVFDEADRLFELGFREQLEEVLDRLAATRQTLLFSATLPQMLADFAKAGLVNPTMIRLDKDEKLSEHLKLGFFSISPNFKLHLLLYLIRHVVKSTEQVIVFVATQLHVQYLEAVLDKLNMPCTYLYSAMDPTSRRINAAKFQKKIVNVLIATDIAARGIDIPNLDYVINYHFPGSSKVFVHRVGRAARAGKSGVALSFVSDDEEAYLWDLHKFLGRSVKFSPKLQAGGMSKAIEMNMEPHPMLRKTAAIQQSLTNNSSSDDKDAGGDSQDGENPQQLQKQPTDDYTEWHFQFGAVPEDIIGEESPQIDRVRYDSELQYLDEKKDNAFRLYARTRPRPSKEALREMKETKLLMSPGDHPLLRESVQRCLHTAYKGVDAAMMERKQMLLNQLRNVRPKKTIFELGSAGSKNACRNMQLKRKRDDSYIAEFQEKLNEKRHKYNQLQEFKQTEMKLPQLTEEDIFYEFPTAWNAKDDIQKACDDKERKRQEKEEQDLRERERLEKKQEKIAEKFRKKDEKFAERERLRLQEHEANIKAGFFIPYQKADMHTEKGYSVSGSSFAEQTRHAQLELQQDDHAGLQRQKVIKKWDEKKNKFIGPKVTEKKVKTESGRVIRGSYKTDRYETWLKRNKVDTATTEAAGGEEIKEEEQLAAARHAKFTVLSTRSTGKVHPLLKEKQAALAAKGTVVREEVRNKQQIRKHNKLQKRYADDRERGQEMKKIKMKLQGNGKLRKKKINKSKLAMSKKRNQKRD